MRTALEGKGAEKLEFFPDLSERRWWQAWLPVAAAGKTATLAGDAHREAPRCARAVVLALAIVLAPFGAKAADLVVWWEKGFYPQEDAAVRELIAAFEQETGKQVELVQHDVDQQTAAVQAAIDAGRPPDFLFAELAEHQIPRWAEEGRLVDLTDTIGALKDLFDADTLELSTLRNGRDGRTALYALPMARDTTHVHVWQSLLKQAGLTLNDIPTGWDAFWSFWCDRAQPAVRKALGRDDIWGVGLTCRPGPTTPGPSSSSS